MHLQDNILIPHHISVINSTSLATQQLLSHQFELTYQELAFFRSGVVSLYLTCMHAFPAPPLLSTPVIEQLADKTQSQMKNMSPTYSTTEKLFDIPFSYFRQGT